MKKVLVGTSMRDKIDGESFDNYINDLYNISAKLLTKEEETEFLEKIKAGDEEAKEEFINRNLRLVVSVAKGYAYCYDITDLVGYGNIGLINAVNMFDTSKDNKFSTYAVHYIQKEIRTFLASKKDAIRIPVYVTNLLIKVSHTKSLLENRLGREVTDKEIAEELGIKLSQIENAKKLEFDFSSFDAPVSNEEVDQKELKAGVSKTFTTMQNYLQSNDPELDESMINKEKQEIIERLFSNLNEKEKAVLKLRFGFVQEEGMTLEEVGNVLGITRERVRQIQNKAIDKIKSSRELERLQEYVPLDSITKVKEEIKIKKLDKKGSRKNG